MHSFNINKISVSCILSHCLLSFFYFTPEVSCSGPSYLPIPDCNSNRTYKDSPILSEERNTETDKSDSLQERKTINQVVYLDQGYDSMFENTMMDDYEYAIFGS